MKPPGSTGAIVNYGNATSPMIGSMPMIETRIGIGSPTLGAPNLTSAPRMPLLERITPRTINATKVAGTAQARVARTLASGSNQIVNTVRGYARALTMRQRPHFSESGSAVSVEAFTGVRSRFMR